MKGNNEIVVNQSTMKDIVQRWVNDEIKSKPQVVSVKAKGGPTDQFEIRLADGLADVCNDPALNCEPKDWRTNILA